MTTEQMNREVAEWLGIEWNNDEPLICPMAMEVNCVQCSIESCPAKRPNPDFSCGAGIIRLLEEMMMRGVDGLSFVMGLNPYQTNCGSPITIPIDYITEEIKLLQAAYEWSKEHPIFTSPKFPDLANNKAVIIDSTDFGEKL